MSLSSTPFGPLVFLTLSLSLFAIHFSPWRGPVLSVVLTHTSLCFPSLTDLCDAYGCGPCVICRVLDITPTPNSATPLSEQKPGEEIRRRQMAVFDGIDDLLVIDLPAWCHQAELSVVWVDFWMRMTGTSEGNTNTYLLDGIASGFRVIRWVLESGDAGDVYLNLFLQSGKIQRHARRWGPISMSVGTWHHFTFTLRTQASFLVQSFFFLDFVQISTASNETMLENLILNSGLSHIIFGGSLTAEAEAMGHQKYAFLKGEIEEFKVWWRPCPITTDPSACNAHAFSLPRLNNGTTIPSARRPDGSRIHLRDVTLDDIALPVRQYAMTTTNLTESAAALGLIIYLNFSTAFLNGASYDASGAPVPALCNLTSEGLNGAPIMCPMCAEECSSSRSSEFDGSTIASAWFTFDTIENGLFTFYAKNGWCQCRDSDTCPQNTICRCPKNDIKVCNKCTIIAICSSGPDVGKPCLPNATSCRQDQPCVDLDASSCPETLCEGWSCKTRLIAEYNHSNAEHNVSLGAQREQVHAGQDLLDDVRICGAEADSSRRNEQDKLRQPDRITSEASPVPFACPPNHTLIHSHEGARQRCCSLVPNGGVLEGSVCRQWSNASGGFVCDVIREASFEWSHDCGIRACCVDSYTLKLAVQLEVAAEAAASAATGCYTDLPGVYVGEDDLSTPPSSSKCHLPDGSMLHKYIDRSTAFEAGLLTEWNKMIDPKIESIHSKDIEMDLTEVTASLSQVTGSISEIQKTVVRISENLTGHMSSSTTAGARSAPFADFSESQTLSQNSKYGVPGTSNSRFSSRHLLADENATSSCDNKFCDDQSPRDLSTVHGKLHWENSLHWRSSTGQSCQDYVNRKWCANGTYGESWLPAPPPDGYGPFSDWPNAGEIPFRVRRSNCLRLRVL